MTARTEETWETPAALSRRIGCDPRTARKFLEQGGVRSRLLPGTARRLYSVAHALEVLALSETEGKR